MSELELKFRLPPGGREHLLKAVGQRHLERVDLDARYFDTPDNLLARHRVAWRLRRENTRWVQTLKASRAHAVERLEHEVELAPGTVPSAPDPSLHDGTEVGALLRKLLARHDEPPLVEIYRAEVVRLRRVLPYREALVEWSLDEGCLVAGDRVRPLAELELEIKGGDPQALYAMGRDWQVRHGLWLDVISKAHRGTLLATGREFADPVKADPPELARGMRGDAPLRAIVAACLAQILTNAGELAGGSHEPEHVHQARVGLRRLRTALHELAALAPGLAEEVEPRLAAVFDALGAVRDRHVIATTLAPELRRAGAPLTDPEAAGESPPDVAALIRGSDFQCEMLRLLAWSQATPEGPDDAKPTALLRKRLDHLLHRVADAARAFETLPLDDQHRTRKRLKRLRYLADFAAPLFRKGRAEAWARAASDAQDALGEHIDHALAARRFEAAAERDPRAWFAAGWLRARTVDSAKAGRRGLARLVRADTFW